MDYLFIRAYGRFAEMPSMVINAMVEMAHQDKAPGNVIFKREDGVWATIEDIGGLNRQAIERIAGQLQRSNPPRTRTIIS
jgi:hypothetical protein